jgi:hypothetical protein
MAAAGVEGDSWGAKTLTRTTGAQTARARGSATSMMERARARARIRAGEDGATLK